MKNQEQDVHDVQENQKWPMSQETKLRLKRKMRLNKIAYIGNHSISADWIKGYEQAIKDLEGFLEVF